MRVRETEQGVLKSGVERSAGINQQSMYGRTQPDAVSNIHTQLIPVVPSGEQLPQQCWRSSESLMEAPPLVTAS